WYLTSALEVTRPTPHRARAVTRWPASGAGYRQRRDLHHLVDRRHARGDLHRAGDAQRQHAVLVGLLAHGDVVDTLLDQRAQRRRHQHDLVEAHAPEETRHP